MGIRRHSHHIGFVFIVVMLLLPPESRAQQPTATITQLTGSAVVSLQGEERAAKLDMVLTEGDTIETKAGASLVLTLSEGSKIPVDEKTKLNLDLLLQTPEGGRKSRLKILYGPYPGVFVTRSSGTPPNI